MSIAYPVMVYNLYDYFLAMAAGDPTGPTLAAIKSSRHDIIKVLVLMHTVFLVMLMLLNIFVSHRIAGPIYKLKQALDAVTGGGPPTAIKFPKMDHFHDLAACYNAMVHKLRETFGDNAKLAADTAGMLESTLASGTPTQQQLQEVVSVLKRISSQSPSNPSG